MKPAVLTIGVLVVDPNRVTREALAAFLRQLGYEVRVALAASDARAVLVGWEPGVAVINLGESNSDGETVAKALAIADHPPIMIGILRAESASSVPVSRFVLFDDLFTSAASPEAVAKSIAHQIAIKTVHLG
jgi:DNA-binding response OmpR family regulator